MVQAQCTDGKTEKSDLICSQWDSINQECILVTQGLLSVAINRRMLEKMEIAEELQQEIVEEQESTVAELNKNFPKAEELGQSMTTKEKDSEAI
jgi:hypothetical protein